MKLYATITSERATKGQGGKWLKIEILDENKKHLGIINVFPQDKDNPYGLISYKWFVGTSEGWQVRSEGILEAKDTEVQDKRGEQQRSENCPFCGTHLKLTDYMCPNDKCPENRAIETPKGKQQKGKICKSCGYPIDKDGFCTAPLSAD